MTICVCTVESSTWNNRAMIMNIVVFHLGGVERFAVEAKQVRELMPVSKLNHLPGSCPSVVGCMSVRGQSVPLLSLTGVFASIVTEQNPGMALVLDLPQPYALRVVQVERVMKIDAGALSRVPSSELIQGVLKEDHCLIQVVNLDALLMRLIGVAAPTQNPHSAEQVPAPAQEDKSVALKLGKAANDYTVPGWARSIARDK